MNRIQLIGNLGNTPQVFPTRDGGKIVRFNLATNERWTDKQSGERRERTEWHRIVIFNEHLAGVAEQFLYKGARVFIEGQVRAHKWQDQLGAERHDVQVELARFNGTLILLSGRRDRDQAGGDDVCAGNVAPEIETSRPSFDLDDIRF